MNEEFKDKIRELAMGTLLWGVILIVLSAIFYLVSIDNSKIPEQPNSPEEADQIIQQELMEEG